MSNVTPFPKLQQPPRPRGPELLVYAARGDVHMHAENIEVELSPEQARTLAQELLELADDAEARPR